jgi:mannosylglucosylglycerate synthase
LKQRIALLHYTSPPVVGGVESTIAYQARELANLGYLVRIISGSGTVFDERIELLLEPRLASQHPDVLTIKKELDSRIVSPAFEALVTEFLVFLQEALADCDVCIAHNVHTLHKNLALTAAFARLEHLPVIAWCNDLAWTNEQYRAELHDGYPWNLMREPRRNTRYVTISEYRQQELAGLMQLPPDTIHMIEPGIDPARFFQWTAAMQFIDQTLHLLDADGMVLIPARITRRKNIEFGLHVLKELRLQSQQDYRLVVTGPPGAHNPANPGYLDDLLHLRQTSGLQHCAHFLYELATPPLIPDDNTIANLYQLADAVLLPSLQEGFGIPVLEAGLAGVPVFCSDIPPFRQTGQEDVHYFEPVPEYAAPVAARMLTELSQHPLSRLRQRVRTTTRWEQIIREKVIPLLEAR